MRGPGTVSRHDGHQQRSIVPKASNSFTFGRVESAVGNGQQYGVVGGPFDLGGLWENWRDLTSGEWTRTFAIITTDANELVADIHNRMPLILAPADYVRWLSDEPDPSDLLRPSPAEPMRMWPISTRVNKPENDDPSILELILAATSEAPPKADVRRMLSWRSDGPIREIDESIWHAALTMARSQNLAPPPLPASTGTTSLSLIAKV